MTSRFALSWTCLLRTQHIQHIKGKAGNENAKVEEVNFINTLNSETMAIQLQHKLEEVEARIVAAAARREQHLNNISGAQWRKNNKKAQVMSEHRLALEKQKSDRWEQVSACVQLTYLKVSFICSSLLTKSTVCLEDHVRWIRGNCVTCGTLCLSWHSHSLFL